jgi:hypothetical protein
MVIESTILTAAVLTRDTVGTNTETEITDGSFCTKIEIYIARAANPRNHPEVHCHKFPFRSVVFLAAVLTLCASEPRYANVTTTVDEPVFD